MPGQGRGRWFDRHSWDLIRRFSANVAQGVRLPRTARFGASIIVIRFGLGEKKFFSSDFGLCEFSAFLFHREITHPFCRLVFFDTFRYSPVADCRRRLSMTGRGSIHYWFSTARGQVRLRRGHHLGLLKS